MFLCLPQGKGINGTIETMHKHASTQKMTQNKPATKTIATTRNASPCQRYTTPTKKRVASKPYPAPAANVLLSRNLAPYLHSKNGAGNPSPIAINASKLFPHP